MTTSVNSGHFLIDQQIQVTKSYLTSTVDISQPIDIQELNQLIQSKNSLIENAKTKGSYQVILEQSLTTQDKPFLYEILIENDPSIIRSSLQNLPAKRVVELLKMIRSLLEQHIKLGKGEDHCLSIGLWLEQLVRLHLTTIVSNIENKQTITSIRKFLQKKTQRQEQLLQIKSHLLSQQRAQQLQYLNQQGKQKKNPKFQYIEEEKEHVQKEEQEEEETSEIKDQDMEGLEFDDLDMDDLLQEDF